MFRCACEGISFGSVGSHKSNLFGSYVTVTVTVTVTVRSITVTVTVTGHVVVARESAYQEGIHCLNQYLLAVRTSCCPT